MNKVRKVLCLLSSVLPVLAITNDSNFGTVEKGNNMYWRFSLLQIMCGATKLYIVTWKKNEDGKVKFKLAKKLSIQECYMPKRKKANDNIEDYKKYLKNINKQQIIEEREDLCYHINNQRERIETSDNKINTYTTIVLTVTPIVMAIIDWEELWNICFVSKFILCFIVYMLFNIVTYVYGYLRVGSYNRYRFCELKISKGGKRKRKEIIRKRNELLYFDWQQLRVDADIKVSYVLNLQKWVVLVFVIVALLTIVV